MRTTPCRALGPWQELCLRSERRVPWGGFEGRRDCISSGSNKVAQLLSWGLILRRLGCWWGDHSNGLAGDGGGLGPGSRGDGEEGSVPGQAVELESADLRMKWWRRCEDGGRDWSNAATSQGMPGATRAGRGKEGARVPPGGVWWLTLALRPLVSGRSVRLYVSVTLSYSVCGILLCQPHGTWSAMVSTWKNK